MSDTSISLIMSLVGCSKTQAEEYLNEAKGDVLLAVCNHTECPDAPGNKYIPPPPKINDGLTDEVRGKLAEARKLSEAFSASFRNDLRGAQEKKAVAEEKLPPVAEESEARIDVGEYS